MHMRRKCRAIYLDMDLRLFMEMEENILEQALRRAANDPAECPEFYRVLLESKILVIGSSDGLSGVPQAMHEGLIINFAHWRKPDGSLFIPFFASLDALQRAIEIDVGTTVNYVVLPAKAFFKMTQGMPLILNLNSDCPREFSSYEIDALVSTGLNRLPAKKPMGNLLLGQLDSYPGDMVTALTTLLSKHANVKAAYLASTIDLSADEKSGILIGIESDEDCAQALHEACAVAADILPEGGWVDVISIMRGEASEVSQYLFENVKPFYERRWGSKLKSDFGVGHA